MPALGARLAASAADGLVDRIIDRARVAQARYEAAADQALYDRAALAAAWTVMEPSRNRALSEMAVASTGLGNVADKIVKNHRKTLGLLRDLDGLKTTGVVADDPATGITEIARPVGVVGAVVPSTNPVATPVNNIVNALKCGNAIVLSPSPKGEAVCEQLIALMHAEFARAGIDTDLVQMLPRPINKARTERLMELADLLIVTGSQANVRAAYSSGRPAIGVGVGNVAVIVDETADLADAAHKIAMSKCFDNATSCSSENAVIVVKSVRTAFERALAVAGGALLDPDEAERVTAALFSAGKLNRDLIARDVDALIDAAALTRFSRRHTRFLVAPAEGIGPEHPLSGEKMALVLALYEARDFAHATELAHALLRHQGAGHSVGLHSRIDARAIMLGKTLPACRIIVNQAHCFATGGAFDNGLPFSLSIGCGSWGGNSIDGNLHWRHFLNFTRIARPIAPREPSLESIFGAYWKAFGK